ncbi:hypothetical protein B0J13DRAFT_215797 [Dactylonectria estremocensis]|uniref:Uncharacterized protein n=1 Tax=Dactylonectria estremocensis TaxID=1079267 RepID=A0A9P9F826_9HYPO|nr:hypothetical protein B0J13DRAFT_215797 [Dactylonectria estremocensis]
MTGRVPRCHAQDAPDPRWRGAERLKRDSSGCTTASFGQRALASRSQDCKRQRRNAGVASQHTRPVSRSFVWSVWSVWPFGVQPSSAVFPWHRTIFCMPSSNLRYPHGKVFSSFPSRRHANDLTWSGSQWSDRPIINDSHVPQIDPLHKLHCNRR